MNTYIALLRGINVGGKNKLPMKELKALLTKHGLHDIQTYIQSGNVVFSCEHFDLDMGKLIEAEFGFCPDVMMLTKDQLLTSIKNCPFTADEGKQLHYYFCKTQPQISKQALTEILDEIKKPSESYQLINDVFYLYAPEGIGRSKLAERVEKKLKVSCTARNQNTILQLQLMLKEKQ
ncbi:DUF1697 domain-containing protein [Marinicellulosiphila megalodicopiae]|uniref:DUF1697 domain-containing protein n=1 Tax=Marinicellulosiphila megalodicopiae TaxID=2724896 RepID=UPI003BB0306D